jgi:hypothetical protein
MGGTLKDVLEGAAVVAALFATVLTEMGAEFEDMDSPWDKGERGCGNLLPSLTKRGFRCNAPWEGYYFNRTVRACRQW